MEQPVVRITLILDRLFEGTAPVLPDAKCVFSYNPDEVYRRTANLESINGVAVNIGLVRWNSTGTEIFKAEVPATYNINGQEVVIALISFEIRYSPTKDHAAFVAFNAGGSVSQSTQNF